MNYAREAFVYEVKNDIVCILHERGIIGYMAKYLNIPTRILRRVFDCKSMRNNKVNFL